MERDRQNFFSFWTFFALLLLPNNPENQNFAKMKKTLETSSFYTCVPQTMIIRYTAPEIWRVMDVIVIFHFGLFFALSSQQQPKKSKFKKNENNAMRYHHFTEVYQKS